MTLSADVALANPSQPLVFPIEVYPDLSPQSYQRLYTPSVPIDSLSPQSLGDAHAYRRFSLSNASRSTNLYIEGHRLGYTDGLRSNKKDGKAYVRLNSGPWFRLENFRVQMPENERRYGGIGGGFRTNHLTISLSRLGGPSVLRNGVNTIYFKMGDTDNVSNGFRILDIKLQDSSNNNLILNASREDNPDSWSAPFTDQANINQGRNLFGKRSSLMDGGRAIVASCKDCHSQDGRDLEYFSYSNGSIVARSVFHGLSTRQGEQIASYIRSLRSAGVKRAGRPWNPPYQPGPGIDRRPVDEWAAGAGLDSVLESDSDSRDHIFPRGRSVAAIKSVIQGGNNDVDKINVREVPVAIQLPDWNDWLPTVHPIDIWGSYYTSELEARHKGFYAVERKISEAMSQGRYGYKEQDSAGYLLQRLTEDVYSFMLRGARDHDYPLRVRTGTIVDRKAGHVSRELANNAMSKTVAVRTFDVMQRLQLEDKAKRIYGNDLAEARQWPVRKFSVFQIAPHVHSNNRHHFTSADLYQTDLKGEYDSVAWYHAQIVLNSGGKVRQGIYPVDWDYQYSFLNYLYNRSRVQTPYLYMLTLMKGMQNNVGPFGIGPEGFMVRFTKPHWLLREVLTQMPDSQSRNNFMTAFLQNYIEIMRDQYGVMRWDGHRFANHSESLGKIWTSLIDRNAVPGEFSQGQVWLNDNADNAYNMAKFYAEQPMVSPEVFHDYLSLAKNLWPLGDFEQFSPSSRDLLEFPRGTTFVKGRIYRTDHFELAFHQDGNLVVYERGVGAIWSTGTGNGAGDRAVYQGDGNLVIYSAANEPVYASNTSTRSPLVLSDLVGLMIDKDVLSRTLARTGTQGVNHGSVMQAGRYKLVKEGDDFFTAYYLNGGKVWSGGGIESARQVVLNDNGLELDGRRIFGVANYNPLEPVQPPIGKPPGDPNPQPDPSPVPSPTPVPTPVPTPAPVPSDEAMFPRGYSFTKGQQHQVNGRSLVFQEDGNLVIYGKNGRPVYASNTNRRGDQLVFQGDGNLVIYDSGSRPIFATGTSRNGEQLVFKRDGRLVVVGRSGQVLWQSTGPLEEIVTQPTPQPTPDPQPVPTPQPTPVPPRDPQPTPTPTVPPIPPSTQNGQVFPRGYTFSKGEEHTVNNHLLAFQGDGNLVIYNPSRQAIYASHTHGRGERLVFQGDGNLVIYDGSDRPLFASNTNGRGESLVFRGDGQLVVLDRSQNIVWSSSGN